MSFANLTTGTFTNYGYTGMAFGGGTGSGPKNWEIDYIRFADEYLGSAPAPDISDYPSGLIDPNQMNAVASSHCILHMPQYPAYLVQTINR